MQCTGTCVMSSLHLSLKNVELELCFYVSGNVCSSEYFWLALSANLKKSSISLCEWFIEMRNKFKNDITR